MGIPHRLALGDRGLDKGTIEYRARNSDQTEEIPITDLVDFIQAKISSWEPVG